MGSLKAAQALKYPAQVSAPPDTLDLGSPDGEFRSLYIGNAGGLYFGLAQDVSLSRIAANILGLAAGDSFRIPSDGQMQWAPISPGTQVIALKSERYNGWAGGISTTYDALQIAGVSGLKARFFQDARLHIWDTDSFLSSAPANPADNATFAFAVYGDMFIGDHVTWTEPSPGSGVFAGLQIGKRIGNNITGEFCTNIWSHKEGVKDASGGAYISLSPDFGSGAVNSGYISLVAYGRGTGGDANRIAFYTRTGVDTITEIARIDSSGLKVGGDKKITFTPSAAAIDCILPAVDARGQIGNATYRFSLVRAVTITSGDFRFENGWRMTEAERLGLDEGIALVKPNGEVAQVWR